MSNTIDFAQKINDRKWYARELASDECLCGKSKKPKFSFCYRCYKALPRNMQKNLYLFIGFGYEEAFDEAVQFLQTEVW